MRVLPKVRTETTEPSAGAVKDKFPGQGASPTSPSEVVRRVVARMTTPLLPDDYLHMVNPLWSARELRGKVVEVIPETRDAATLVIKPGWGWNINYQPGQYVGIGVHIDGKWHWRSYSVSSTPEGNGRNGRGRQLAITVKAMPEGFLSEHLVRGLDAGTIVRLALPQGEFVLPDPPPPKILFWTGGSGITPVMSMLRTLHRRHTMPDVVHIHSSPSIDSAIFREERLALADQHPGLRDRELRRSRRHPRCGETHRGLPRLEHPRGLGLRPGTDVGRRGDVLGGGAARQETASRALLRRSEFRGRGRSTDVRLLQQVGRCGRRHHVARSR